MNAREAAQAVAAALLHTAQNQADPSLAARLLAQTLGALPPELQQGLIAALGGIPPAGQTLDALWACWAETRQPALAALLSELARPAAQPTRLAVLSALFLGQTSGLPQNAALVEALLAACTDPDNRIAAAAAHLLQHLSAPAAQEEVCRWVMEHDDPQARQAALAAGYAPHSAPERALFFLLSGQWQRYETLDFDTRLLETVYAAGSESLRQQIASLARQRGWGGFVQAVSSGRARRRLGSLDEFEWEAVLVILGRERRWADLWKLSQSAPPAWSARLLRSLQEAGWLPADPDERRSYLELASMAADCLEQGKPGGKLVRSQAVLYGHTRQITALLCLKHDHLAATASADQTVRLWDLETGKLVKTLSGHTDFVFCLAQPPAQPPMGDWLASGSADKTVRLWSLPDGAPLGVLGGHSGRVSYLAASPGQIISGDEHSLYLWNSADLSLNQALRGQVDGLNALEIYPHGTSPLLVSGDSARSTRLWNLPGGELRRSLLTPIVGWAVSPSRGLLASASSYSAVQLWKLPEGDLLRSLPGRANTTLLTFSPNGRWLACADQTNVLLWDLDNPGAPQTLPGSGLTSALTFSPDSRLLAAGTQGRTVGLWELPETGAPQHLRTLEGYTTPVRQLAFTPNGQRLVCTDDLSLHIWTVDDLKALLNTPTIQAALGRLEKLRSDPERTPNQRAWLGFALALAHWQRRFDIELHDPAAQPSIPIGEFDIDIEV